MASQLTLTIVIALMDTLLLWRGGILWNDLQRIFETFWRKYYELQGSKWI